MSNETIRFADTDCTVHQPLNSTWNCRGRRHIGRAQFYVYILDIVACLVHLIHPVQQVVLRFLNPLGQGILEGHRAPRPPDLVDLRQNVPLVHPLNHLETMATHHPRWAGEISQAQGEATSCATRSTPLSFTHEQGIPPLKDESSAEP